MRFIHVIDQDDNISFIAINKIVGVDDTSTENDISVRIYDGGDETYQFNGDIIDFMLLVTGSDPNPVFRSPREN